MIRNGVKQFLRGVVTNSKPDRWNSIISEISSCGGNGEKFTVKDNILTIGTTTCGSKILSEFESPFDATVVKLLQDKGYNLVGKTNLDEFGMGSSNTNSNFGPSVNPLFEDGEYVTGGSSGGSAATVAGGLCEFSLGTDTGGSIRLPASNCGVYGFKPSYGRLSRWGVIPYAQTLDTVGIIARTCEKVQEVFEVLDKYDSKDPTSLSVETRKEISTVVSKRNSLRNGMFNIGIPEEFLVEELSDATRNKLSKAAEALLDMGHNVVAISIPSIEKSLSAYYTIATAEAASNLSRYDGIRFGKGDENLDGAANVVKGNRSLGFGKEVQRRIILGNYTISSDSGDHYIKATELRRHLADEFNNILYIPNLLTNSEFESKDVGKCDFILASTTINTPTTIEEFLHKEHQNLLESYTNDILTTPMSLTGVPTISLPILDEGKAISTQGIQLFGQFGDDRALLQISSHLMNHLL
ncbi:Trimeric GatFAB AmidoTransferase(AdT) complex subunit [Yamadazyma tenuis]|uniref:Glutamyl-tRNA(Gln) amidotransferase subunit A, mitochondrial n=1 Tax=Candida tenuis (strain ATCC 10573 / BCRC 21748 / CBS 615 / JCM 9827 / NBRC 10315 / NRRL Y-1498 / VKM Y-70) TaxID=590646 RepID=G3B4G6_CANTC|nr:amidase signature enzyme [Yamadazyma tenuis ATCC 10573]EGV63823.1 amidase signature enzyme [Yamadazyma tenuis ATCC 10573]WEJ96569.1 Trimeric GatFAB AmidoTransferase(AdT) complex subunit [Yamadazyma tenuis]